MRGHGATRLARVIAGLPPGLGARIVEGAPDGFGAGELVMAWDGWLDAGGDEAGAAALVAIPAYREAARRWRAKYRSWMPGPGATVDLVQRRADTDRLLMRVLGASGDVQY